MLQSIIAMIALSVIALPAQAAAPPDNLDEQLKSLSVRAKIERDAHRYIEAAKLLDEGYRLAPTQPDWLANAGYCRMMGGELGRAIDNLSTALQDARLTELGRTNALERLKTASAVHALLQRTEEDKAKGEFLAAAKGYDNAFSQLPLGAYLIEAAALWERAGDLDVAQQRYLEAVERQDLTEPQRRDVLEALSRVAKAKIDRNRTPQRPQDILTQPFKPEPAQEPSSSPPVAGWVLVGTGAAVTGFAVAAFVLSNGDHEAAQSPSITRERYRELDDSARSWWTTGLVAGGVGVAAALTGVILIATHDGGSADTEGQVLVTGGVFPQGGHVAVKLGF